MQPVETPHDRKVDFRHRARQIVDARLADAARPAGCRSEEHTSELQSLTKLVCRLLLEKTNGRTTSRCWRGILYARFPPLTAGDRKRSAMMPSRPWCASCGGAMCVRCAT